jgi:hypothetical protein
VGPTVSLLSPSFAGAAATAAGAGAATGAAPAAAAAFGLVPGRPKGSFSRLLLLKKGDCNAMGSVLWVWGRKEVPMLRSACITCSSDEAREVTNSSTMKAE